MAQSFHLFPSLPLELRLRVWESAVVDRSIAGVNFFRFERRFRRDYPASIAFLPLDRGPHCDWSCLQDLACSTWQHGKKSTSEEDSSLWVTCRDSRHVMKQMMERLERDQNAPSGGADLSSAGGQSHRTGGYPLASTGISTDHHYETRRFTFVPTRDLFVFCPHNIINANLAPWLERDIDCVPPSERSSLDCIDNFAFEIGSYWPKKCDILRLATACHRIAIARAKTPLFYLIDYRLLRQKGPTADRQTTTVFQAVGGRFFEVQEDGSWEYDAEVSLDNDYVSIFDFVAGLARMACYRALQRDVWCRDVSHDSFRVLAYEPDGKDVGSEKKHEPSL